MNEELEYASVMVFFHVPDLLVELPEAEVASCK